MSRDTLLQRASWEPIEAGFETQIASDPEWILVYDHLTCLMQSQFADAINFGQARNPP